MAIATLIRPPSVVARFALTLNQTPPISLAYLAGALANRAWEVQVIDAVGEALDAIHPGYRPQILINGLTSEQIVAKVDPATRLIGISILFSHEWPVVRELITLLRTRFPSIPIVCGGEHPTALPEQCLEDAPGLTACAVGEGEATLVELGDAILAGSSLEKIPGLVVRTGQGLVNTGRRARIAEVDAIAEPRWDLTPIEHYLDRGLSFGVDRGRTMPLLATRGCPYQCTFCSSPKMWTTRYSTRTPASVVDEIESYVRRYRVENVDFYDLTSIIEKEWILEFCREIRRRGLRILWQLPSGTRSEALDAEVLAAMATSGCTNVSYAPESGSERTLREIKKKVKVDRILGSMKAAVAAGVNVKANILIGFPDETADDVWQTLRFVARMARAGVHDVSVWTFSPYPGSELFDRLRASGQLPVLDDDYFASLLSYSDVSGAVSYAAALPSKTLQRYRVTGLLLFYAISYLRHPHRPIRSLYNVATRRYESRMEMSLGNLVRRLGTARRGAEAT